VSVYAITTNSSSPSSSSEIRTATDTTPFSTTGTIDNQTYSYFVSVRFQVSFADSIDLRFYGAKIDYTLPFVSSP
jgi:hypothetical protein